MVFTFKIVKTEFHSGRLAVAFFPAVPGQGDSRTLAQTDYVNREIIDVRDANIFTIVVPFISESPYRTTDSANDGPIGTLSIFVLDPLVAPASVSSSVSIILEAAGGPDIEFAFPSTTRNLVPVFDATPQMGVTPETNECRLISTNIGNTMMVRDDFINSGACIGERISSFRTLLKSANWMSGSNTEATALSYCNILPFAIQAYDNVSTNPNPSISGDLYGSLASCYGLSRGGVRLRLLPVGATGQTGPDYMGYTYYNAGTTLAMYGMAAADLNGNTGYINHPLLNNVAYNANSNAMMEFQIPQYDLRHSRANAAQLVNRNIPYVSASLDLGSKVAFTIYSDTATETSYNVARSGADDLNLGQFVSIPPMCTVAGIVN